MTEIRSLAIHASYRCRHTGACCSSDWPIPIEADRLDGLGRALASGRLHPARGAGAVFERPPDAPPDTPAVLGRHASRCVFFDDEAVDGGGRCRVHASLGHEALPLACRQFPRVSLRDPRGVSVTLSHYCPSAAALLDLPPSASAAVVASSPAFPASGEYVGLDVRQALPPSLRHDMLMDWEAWWECERLAVELLAGNDEGGVALALTRLRLALDRLHRWSPADRPLIDHVRDAFLRAASARPVPMSLSSPALVEAVYRSIQAGIRPPRPAGAVPTTDAAARRFLAAHAFGSWAAHLGDGLDVWLNSIAAAAALLEAGAGVRHADLLLRHLADPNRLATALRRKAV